MKEKCEIEGFIFIENSNIYLHHLWKDGVHLENEGKDRLANNFIYSLNGTNVHIVKNISTDMNQRLYNFPINRKYSINIDTDFLTILGDLHLKYVKRIIFAHMNIKSIRNKFNLLTNEINDKLIF